MSNDNPDFPDFAKDFQHAVNPESPNLQSETVSPEKSTMVEQEQPIPTLTMEDIAVDRDIFNARWQKNIEDHAVSDDVREAYASIKSPPELDMLSPVPLEQAIADAQKAQEDLDRAELFRKAREEGLTLRQSTDLEKDL